MVTSTKSAPQIKKPSEIRGFFCYCRGWLGWLVDWLGWLGWLVGWLGWFRFSFFPSRQVGWHHRWLNGGTVNWRGGPVPVAPLGGFNLRDELESGCGPFLAMAKISEKIVIICYAVILTSSRPLVWCSEGYQKGSLWVSRFLSPPKKSKRQADVTLPDQRTATECLFDQSKQLEQRRLRPKHAPPARNESEHFRGASWTKLVIVEEVEAVFLS